MPKQLNVDLTFRANTDQAKRQIADLQKSLQAVGTSSKGIDIGVNAEEIKKASAAAAELQRHLTAATDVNTGKLNLSTFSASLKASGKTLQQYKAELEAIGPQGQKAFDNLSRSIANAEAPIKRTNKLLAEMGTVLKNTIRWQLSSTMIHGFMGAVQQAYGYVQDLNESLTNIRIVTGQSTEQMAAFADRANKAAQSLSTTTTAYTDAALIFYQQGLSDKEVEERTNATIKMAQVTGDSVQEVSSYMTAIWNNFDDGSESLEHYTDVITALGAATASSSAEISQGLEKFASIADTVGLSYEYATTALATVVAQTRQSADVVGTAFKTMFARIQDLELGKTLEDGVDLGQYSKALAKVGVDVMDANGQLRAMDDILDDIGQRWSELGEAERVALAQNVAGQRQYAQFMAIFENWDTFQENLKVANTSDGTLQKQADIYAESWEGAEKRVRAAMEDIYDDILNDKFFIQLTNGFAEVLKGVKGLMEGMGGLKGMIPIFAGFITQKLAKEAPTALNKIKENLMIISGKAGEVANRTQQENLNTIQTEQRTFNNVYRVFDQSAARQGELQGLEALAKARMIVNKNAHLYSEQEKADAEAQIAKINEITQNLKKEGQAYDELKSKRDNHLDAIENQVAPGDYAAFMNFGEKAAKNAALVREVDKDFTSKANAIYDQVSTDASEYNKRIQELINSYSKLGSENKKVADYLKEVQTAFDLADGDVKEFNNDIQSGFKAGATASTSLEAALTVIQNYANLPDEEVNKLREELLGSANAAVQFNNNLQQSEQIFPQLQDKIASTSEVIASIGGAMMTMQGQITAIGSSFSTLFDEDASAAERFGAAIGLVSSSIMTLNALSKVTQTLQSSEIGKKTLNVAVTKILAKVKKDNAVASDKEAAKTGADAGAQVADAAGKGANTAATHGLTGALVGLETAALPVLLTTLAIGAALAALATVAFLVSKAIQAASDAYHKDAIAAKEAAETASELKEKFTEAQEAYDSLKSSLESYEDAKKGLDELTKGTEAWTEALVATNKQATDLIFALNLIKGQDWVYDENGVIQIQSEAVQRALNERLNTVVQYQNASIMAQSRSEYADIQSDITDFARQHESENITVRRRNINGGEFLDRLSETDFRNLFNEAFRIYSNGDSGLLGLGNEYNDIEINENLRNELIELCESLEFANNSITDSAEMSVRNALQLNEEFNSIDDENVSELVAQASSRAFRQNLDQYSRDLDYTSNENLIEQFQDLVDDSAIFEDSSTNEAGNFEFTRLENGQRVDAELSRDQIEALVANAQATQDLNTSISQLIITLTQYANGTLAQQAIGTIASTGSLEGATFGQFRDLSTGFDADENNLITGQEVLDYLIQDAGGTEAALEQRASELGYTSGQAYYDAVWEAFVQGNAMWGDIASQGLEGIDSQLVDSLTGENASRIIGKVSELTLGPLGEQAGDSFISGINTALEGVDVDSRTDALNSFLDIDWSSDNALEQMAENMSEFGAEIDITSSYWQNFAEEMQQADSYVPAFEDLKQNLQDVSAILGKLDFGSAISPEDYETLVAYNDEWERFFILQADGSRKFIGNSQQMLEATRAQIREQQLELNEQRAMAEQFSSNWRDVDWSNLTNRTTGNTYSYSSIVSGLMNGSDNTQAVLEQLGYSSDRLQEILNDLDEEDEEVASAAREAVEQLASHINEFISYDFAEDAQEIMEMYASTATDYYELSRMLSEGIIDDAAYQKQSEYLLNTITSVEQLEDAYAAGYIALEQYNEVLDEVTRRQAEAFGLEGDSVVVQAQEMADTYELEAGAAARLALQNQLMNRGVSTLVQNWENWREELEATDTTTQDYADTVVDVTKVIKDLVGIVDDDFVLSSGFLKTAENIELLEQAAQGSEEAIERLGIAVAQDLVKNLEAVDFTSLSFDSEEQKNDFSKIFEGFEENKNIVLAGLEELQAQINDIGVGEDVTSILGDEWITALNEMAMATQMSVDDMNNMLNSIGVEADVVTVREPQKVEVPVYETVTHVQDEGDPETGDGRVVRTTTNMVGTETMDGFVEVAQINTGEKVGSAPSSSRIIKTGNGGISSSARGSGSSGGGGGSSGSKKKPKDPTGEIERYHVINNQIEDNEKALDRLSKAKDRAYGKAKLNAMDTEIAKQRESVELAERKLQEVEKYLELDSGAIAAFGAEFDTNGTIVNYDQLMQEQIDKYNAAVEAYNNGPMDENAEAVFQQAEDDYNAFTEALKQYEETQDLWYEQAQAVADAKAEVLQLELEKTNYKVEIGIEWEEEDIARLDFMLKRIEDDAHKAAEAIGLLGERTVDAMDKYNVYQQGFADTLRNLGVGNAEDVIARASAGEDLYGMIGNIVDPNEMAQAVDQMDDYISNMMSSLEDAQESVDQAFEKVKDLFNENVKQMDTYIEKIEFCQKITKSYMNIVDILGKKSLGITNEMLRTFNTESVTQAINNEAAAKAKMDSIQAQLMESQARLAQASGELEQKYWNEIIEEQEKELISATENFHQAWEDALQANLEAFENNIELVIEDFSNAVGDLNAMKAEWDLQKSLTDMWEPEYERWHQLSDLINDINKSVDENENLKYKQDLLDLETEIEQLQEQEAKLSEYDLNYLRLRYESKLAEIALEEAQAAKSQVRMSRDNEGNYSYVYTADEEAVNNAADDYRNKIYEMEKANEEYIDTLQQQLLEMHDKMLEDIQQAGELYGVGTQAYYDAVARIQETYVGQSEFIQLQMQNVFTNNQRLRDEDIVQYVAYTGDIAAENVDLQTSFGDTYMGIQTQTDDLQTYFNDTWLPALSETFDNVILKAEEYSQQNEVAMETAGTTMDGFRDRASQDILEVTERTTELTEETQRYGETAVDQFAQAARAWQTGPGALLDAINAQATAIANLAQQYTSLKSQLDAAAQAARDFAAAMGQRASVSSSIPSVSPASGGSGSPSSSSFGGRGAGGKGTLINSGTVTPTVHSSDYYNWLANDPNASEELRRRGLLRFFDTGGYTGEWGDDGRIAVLHQKELVLNAKDTSNILTAVDVVRQLASSIDFNTMTASLATASIKSASGNSGTVEQRVEITANFPNATDKNEIEQAFQNIVNMASQYAQRKND